MWYFGILLIVTRLTPGYLFLDPCERLLEKYKGYDRKVRMDGEEMQVIVQGGAGSVRAAAALLHAAVKYGLHYPAVLMEVDADLCTLARSQHKAVLSPAAILDPRGCEGGSYRIDRISDLTAPSFGTFNLNVKVRILSKIEKCRNIFDNINILESCGFLRSNKPRNTNIINSTNCDENFCALILARNESNRDQRAITQLIKIAELTGVKLQFVIYANDTEFRRNVFKRRNDNATFVFIDENIWAEEADVIDVKLPSCVESICNNTFALDHVNTFRIGNGYYMKEYAPLIYETVKKFSPTVRDLHDVLFYEASCDTNIKTAACDWALKNTKTFMNWFTHPQSPKASSFVIMVCLCKYDMLNKYYEPMINLAGKTLKIFDKKLIYVISATYVNCSEPDNLKNVLNYLNKQTWAVGAVAWSWNADIEAASRVAKQIQMPLMIAGPVNDKILGPPVYASTGRLSSWIKAHQHFLANCGWKRIAILSDDTVYARLFSEAILDNKNITSRQEVVTKNTIIATLENIKQADARIILINADCETASVIISLSTNKGMLPQKGYIWLLREWCIITHNETLKNMWHYTVGLSWRGGNTTVRSKIKEKVLEPQQLWKFRNHSIVSPGTSYLVNALLQLGSGFSVYRRDHPSNLYDLHGRGSALNFTRSLSRITVAGLAQAFKIKNYSVENPTIFIDKWQGNEHKTTALWKIVNNSVVEIWTHVVDADRCRVLLDAEPVPDGAICLTISSGDSFTPRCHDLAILLFIIALVLCVLALIWTRRVIKARQLAHEMAWQRKPSALVDFMVDRKSIKLLHEIGTGSFGRVHFAELTRPGSNTLVVAAKEPRDSTLSDDNEFLREAYVLARLEHSNVIKLVGVCLTNGPPLVLMEHAIYLDLQRYLIERRHATVDSQRNSIDFDNRDDLSDRSLTRWATEAASAVEYLANQRFVHRDIRAANCLIDRLHSLKLADFGMARELDEEDSLYLTKRRAVFPVLWMSPESLAKGVFTPASDIWSLGVLLLEIATLGLRPYGNWPPTRVYRFVLNGGKPPLPPDISVHTNRVLQQCWYSDPDDRITATHIHEYLQTHPKAISPAVLAPVPSFLDLYPVQKH